MINGQFLRKIKAKEVLNYSKFNNSRRFQSEKTLLSSGVAVKAHDDVSQGYSEYLYGVHPVSLALAASKRTFYGLFVKDAVLDSDRRLSPPFRALLERAELLGLEARPCCKRELDRLTNQRPHQGVVLRSSVLPLPYLHEAADVKAGLFVFLDEIKDVMNFGSILRSCAFFGVRGIYLPCNSSVSPSPIISKISSGAQEIVNLYRVNDKAIFVRDMRELGVTIVGTSGEEFVSGSRTLNIDNIEYVLAQRLRQGPTLLVLGREDRGLTSEVASLCHYFLRIPHLKTLHSQMSSLNVATATSVLLYFLSINIHNSDV